MMAKHCKTCRCDQHDPYIDVGGATLLPHTRALRGPQAAVGLTQLDFAMLTYLADHRGQLLDREPIAVDVWGYKPGSPPGRVIDMHVGHLRAALAQVGAAATIEGVRGAGYRLDVREDLPVKRSGRNDVRLLSIFDIVPA